MLNVVLDGGGVVCYDCDVDCVCCDGGDDGVLLCVCGCGWCVMCVW